MSVAYDATRVGTRYQRLLSALDGGVVASGVIPGTALEVGPGTGRITARLLDRGLEVSAVDVSEGMLAALRRRLPAIRAHVRAIEDLSSVEHYGRFDNAVSCRVLPHVPAARDALAILARAVHPGGRVIFDLWSAWGYVALSRVLHLKRSRVYTRFVSPREARGMIAGAGLRVVRTRGIGFGPLPPYLLELLGETPLRRFAHIQLFVCERLG